MARVVGCWAAPAARRARSGPFGRPMGNPQQFADALRQFADLLS